MPMQAEETELELEAIRLKREWYPITYLGLVVVLVVVFHVVVNGRMEHRFSQIDEDGKLVRDSLSSVRLRM